MKRYETPALTVYELTVDAALADVIRSKPTVEDNDDDLSV